MKTYKDMSEKDIRSILSKWDMFFVVEGEAVGKMRPKVSTLNGHASVYTPRKQIVFENWVRTEYEKAMELFHPEVHGYLFGKGVPIEIRIQISKRVPSSVSMKKRDKMLYGQIFPVVKPDIDNVAKSVLDALNRVAFYDDSQVIRLAVFKTYESRDFIAINMREVEPEVDEDDLAYEEE